MKNTLKIKKINKAYIPCLKAKGFTPKNRKDKPEEVRLYVEHISNPAKWDYCGFLSKEDKKVLET